MAEYKPPSYWTKRRKIRQDVEKQINDILETEALNEDQTGIMDLESTETVDNCSSISMSPYDLENAVEEEQQETRNSFSDAENENDVNTGFETYEPSVEYTPFDKYYSSDEEYKEEEEEEEVDRREMLASWAGKHRITHAALAEVLQIFRTLDASLPKDPRTIIGKPPVINLKEIAGGSYYHIGIASNIASKLAAQSELFVLPDKFSLQVNIDGLPLFKSSNIQLWPILAFIEELPLPEPFVIGIFSGASKPKSVDEFLEDFVAEMTELTENGICLDGKRYDVEISCLVCDAPARSFIKRSKGHTGYSSCEKCTQKGKWEGKMTFPETDALLRNDIQFNEMEDENHHTGTSPLSSLPIGLVSQFPLDYMHLVCLGVMRRLIHLWTRGPLTVQVGRRVKETISDLLVSLQGYIPREFSRKPRSLQDQDRWKATEFRQFLIYTGPLVLLRNLTKPMYNNFMLFSVAMFLLLSPSHCERYADYASQLLVLFVKQFSDIYGTDMVVYNVHGLVHLAQDAKKYGNLDKISAFPFENYLRQIKRMVRKPSYPLQQIARQLNVKKGMRSEASAKLLKKSHSSGPLPEGFPQCFQYKFYQSENFVITTSSGDNCIKVNDSIAVVRNIVVHDADVHVVYVKFRTKEPFFSYPLCSSELEIYKVSRLSEDYGIIPVSETSKYVLLPNGTNSFVAIPLLHFS